MIECEPGCEYCAINNDEAKERFYSQIKKTEDGCWLWQGALKPLGYGRIRYMGKTMFAHRFSKSMIEPLVENLEIDHLCRNRACVNPDHLEQVDHRTNIYRSPIHFVNDATKRPNKGVLKTHCKYGHLKSGANLSIWGGARICRKCYQVRKLKYRSKPSIIDREREYARNYKSMKRKNQLEITA